MKNIRIGFLGTGWINETHAKALLKLPNITIAALYNHNIGRARSFNEKLLNNQAECYDDWEKMLRTQKLDALYVAIPPGGHIGQTELAAQLGMHLMLEKPIALTLDRAQSITAAVKKAGVLCQVGYHMRHSAPAIKLKQMLTDGSAGRPLMMQGRFFTNGMFPKWWRDPSLGGGQLIEQSIHIYDIARYFMGEPDVISGFCDNLLHQRFDDYKVDDVSASVVRFKNGAIASICASNCADPKQGSVCWQIQCEKVIAEFKSPETATFIYTGGKISDEINRGEGEVTREEITTPGSVYDELTSNFIGAIREGTPLRSNIDDGLNSLRMVLAASESSRTNGTAQRL